MGQYPIFTSTSVAMFKTRVGRSIIDYILFLKGMAKSDSFFIRAKLEDVNPFDQIAIDLGAYVDALGKSVLRIHNVQVQYVFGSFNNPTLNNPNTESAARWQLTTQSTNQMERADDKSLISSGSYLCSSGAAGSGILFASQDMDINPQSWTNGYLVGVEQIYLGGTAGSNFEFAPDICIVLECTVETLSQSAAMALALSQQ